MQNIRRVAGDDHMTRKPVRGKTVSRIDTILTPGLNERESSQGLCLSAAAIPQLRRRRPSLQERPEPQA